MPVTAPVAGVNYRGGQLSKPITAYQPIKLIWGIAAILANTAQFPLWVLYYIFPFNRPNPKWSLQTCIMNVIVSRDLYHRGVTQAITPLSLSPGREKTKWEVIHPSTKDVYKGVAKHASVKPVPIGGCWFPAPPTGADKINRTTILHFHGGAFVIGEPRDWYVGFLGRTLNKHVADQVCSAGYRLASNEGGQFPAQLQDAITWYSNLLDRGIPANKIILSGDSAGANLVMQLLRYIDDNKGVLPSPGAALLWSPWIDMISAFHTDEMVKTPRYKTDYIVPGFPIWGTQSIAKGVSPLDPYLSPVRKAFVTETPIFIQGGGCEILLDDIITFKEEYEAVEKDGKKNTIHFHLAEDCNHDVILVGHLMGLKKQAIKAAEDAGNFVTKVLGTPAKL